MYSNCDCIGGIHCRGIAICWYRCSKMILTTNLTTPFDSCDKMADDKNTDWHQDGIENLVPRYEKCLDFYWDWAGK